MRSESRNLALTLMIAAAGLTSLTASAQAWGNPSVNVELIVPAAAGGRAQVHGSAVWGAEERDDLPRARQMTGAFHAG